MVRAALVGAALVGAALLAAALPAAAQVAPAGAAPPTAASPNPAPPNPAAAALRDASRLDVDGVTTQVRVRFQQIIDSAPDPAAKAGAQRAMAMSYAFDGDCANTVRYEQMAIAYWATREMAEPQNELGPLKWTP